jgi:hypothetical protein
MKKATETTQLHQKRGRFLLDIKIPVRMVLVLGGMT